MALALNPSSETACLLALSRVRGLGARTLHPLLKTLGSAEALWEAPLSRLQELMSPSKLELLLAGRRDLDPNRLYEPYASHRLGVQVLGLNDPAYPALLKETYSPPLVLYIRGNPQALQQSRMLAVVGTRGVSEYGTRVTDAIMDALRAAGPCIVSGLAYGVDALAHAAALRNELPTVAVLGSGVDILSPAGNRRLAERILSCGGAIVSEYPLGAQATRHTFPERNRIVAGMCQGTLVVEGGLKSGALITARVALEENRTVFAVPGSVFCETAEGPLRLIREGATPVTGGRDLLSELGWSDQSPSAPTLVEDLTGLSEGERTVLRALTAEPVTIEALQRQTGLETTTLSGHLTMLELDGRIAALPGGRVRRLF